MDRARLPFGVFAVPVDVNPVPAQRNASRASGRHGVNTVLIERRGGDLLDRIVLVGREQNGDEWAIQRLPIHGGLAGHFRPSFPAPRTREQPAQAQGNEAAGTSKRTVIRHRGPLRGSDRLASCGTDAGARRTSQKPKGTSCKDAEARSALLTATAWPKFFGDDYRQRVAINRPSISTMIGSEVRPVKENARRDSGDARWPATPRHELERRIPGNVGRVVFL